jgi:hypothetical protein
VALAKHVQALAKHVQAKFGQDEWAAGKENMLTVPEDSCLST